MKIVELAVFFCVLYNVESLKIFGLFPVQTYSHFAPALRLMNALVEKGHDVTVAAAYTDKSAKYKSIHLKGLMNTMNEVNDEFNFYDMSKNNWLDNILVMHALGEKLTRDTLNCPELKTLLASDQQFDIVILDLFLNEANRGICHKYNSACVIYSAIPNGFWINDVMGNPDNPAYNPTIELMKTGNLNFIDRFKNTIFAVTSYVAYQLSYLPKQNNILKEHFPKSPSIWDLYNTVDLMLMNAYPGMTDPVPKAPSVIDIGGFHVKPLEKLPKELESFLDESKEGVILFSMGSVLKSNEMPKEKLSVILNSFSKLKQKVLWKLEGDVANLPKNVKIMKWVPQQSVLAHPNVKAFVTHSGLFSSIEAIYFGVPVVGIPIFAEQMYNAKRSADMGMGTVIYFNEINEKDMDAALDEVLNNPKYTETAKRRSKILRDQPQDPLERAIFWVEYAFRHKGSKHMQSPLLKLAWYQYLLLDVIAFTLIIVVSIFTALSVVVRCIFCRSKTRKIKSKESDKKNK